MHRSSEVPHPARTAPADTTSPRGVALSRRTLLGLAAASGAALGLGGLWAKPAYAADDFQLMRDRWRDYRIGTDVDPSIEAVATALASLDSEAAEVLKTAATDLGPGVDIWSTIPMAGPHPANYRGHFLNIVKVTLAWLTPGTDQFKDPAVLERLLAWVNHMVTHWFNETTEYVGSWWFWEIGTPGTVGDLAVLLHDQLPAEDIATLMTTVARFVPDPNYRQPRNHPEQGGNRADKAQAAILRGIATDDATVVSLARDALSDVKGGKVNSLFKVVTSGNGFYADGSYVDHDRIAYVGSYGVVALTGAATSLMLLGGTRWEVTDPDVNTLLDSPEKSFDPFIWNGRMMDTVCGRAVSREAWSDSARGASVTSALLVLAVSAAEPYRTRFRELAKSYITRCSADYIAGSGLAQISRALPVLNDTSIVAAAVRVGHVQYGSAERSVHRRPTWSFTVSTASKRIGRYEAGNFENKTGWYQGDGQSYLYLDNDQAQFAGSFWPTVDPYRLPGTSVTHTKRTPIDRDGTERIPGTQAWAGGVSLTGRFGSIGMAHENFDATLRGNKSWFCLDDAVICVGNMDAGTHASVTTVENRRFGADDAPRVLVNGTTIKRGSPRLFDRARWAHVAGVGGYRFLGSARLDASIQARSGAWSDINSSGPVDRLDARYALLTIAHPEQRASQYGYVMQPNASVEETERPSDDQQVRILQNDAAAHVVAVTEKSRQFLFAHSFRSLGGARVTASAPCALAVLVTKDRAVVAISDPTKQVGTVNVTVNLGGVYSRVRSADERISIKGTGRRLSFTANLAGTQGSSIEAVLRAG